MTKQSGMDAVQVSFLGGADDAAYRREQKRKRIKPPAPGRPWPDGPCCGRCRHWRPPGPQDDFGECRVLVVTLNRLPAKYEKGTVLGLDDAVQYTFLEWEYLPSGPRFDCSRFDERAVESEAA